MRLSAWCLAGVLLACGKSERTTERDGTGPRGGAGAGGSSALSSGSGGTSGSVEPGGTGGDVQASGGAPSAGTGGATAGTAGGELTGGAPAAGGAGNGSGGAAVSGGADSGVAGVSAGLGGGGDSSVAGEAGEAGAPALECDGSYTACGCACCAKSVPNDVCYYPEIGNLLEQIRADDQGIALNPSCRDVPCGSGERYFCCMTAADAGSPTYKLGGYSSDAQHMEIRRTDEAGRCTSLWVVSHGVQSSLPLEAPSGFAFEMTSDGECEDGVSLAPTRPALGALGSARFTTPDRCSLDLDFTLFFLAEDETVEAVRFLAAAVPFPTRPSVCD